MRNTLSFVVRLDEDCDSPQVTIIEVISSIMQRFEGVADYLYSQSDIREFIVTFFAKEGYGFA